MNKKLFSLFMFCYLFLLAGCNNDSSIITHTRPADWTVEGTRSYLHHFRPEYNFSKEAVKEILQNTPYYKINNMIYYGDYISKTYVENSDVDSFFPLVGDYGLDNYALYIGAERYPVDTGSLIIYRDYSYIASSGIVYVLHGDSVMKPLTGANPDRFTPLPQIISEGEVISYNSIYAKDDKFIYVQDKVLTGVDPEKFILLSFPISEESLSHGIYAKYDTSIYYKDQILTGADYDSFELIDGVTAKDKNNTYKNGKIVQ